VNQPVRRENQIAFAIAGFVPLVVKRGQYVSQTGVSFVLAIDLRHVLRRCLFRVSVVLMPVLASTVMRLRPVNLSPESGGLQCDGVTTSFQLRAFMANTIRILLSDSFDPYFNLAVEDAIFRNMSTEKRILFLWRNKDTVVIGKGQNPWRECNTAQMEKDGVKLARRKSGGGAVFHDKGNTNFTLMGGKPEFDKAISTQIVLDALQSIGINGKSTGRNDLVVETDDGDRKFSIQRSFRPKESLRFAQG